jgi:diguanylate cyclase (GGDEF)-like protein
MAQDAATTGQPLGVAVLDLDHLKAVNDALGHRSGDELLGIAASRLRAAARAEDLVARLGGDEFGVLLPGAPPATVEAVLQRMTDAMSGTLVLCGRTVSASVSGGSSVGSGAVSLETLLHEADLAMYRAKADGRGRVHAYDDAVSRSDPRTAAAEVHQVLAEDGLLVVRQPICQLSTGLLVGHEALSRFPGRDHREVGEWFALARVSGSAPALESRAIALARDGYDPTAGMYLTGQRQPVGARHALGAGRARGRPDRRRRRGDRGLAAGPHRARPAARAAARPGGPVAMDDTGAGYDGLRRLVQLRPEIVKLDRELVHAVHQHPRSGRWWRRSSRSAARPVP